MHLTYPYWNPVLPLESRKYGLDLVADVRHHSGLHSWYKGGKTPMWITFNKRPQPGNSNERDPPQQTYHAWFSSEHLFLKESREDHLQKTYIDGWWNPRNYPRNGEVPKSFSRQEEYNLFVTDPPRNYYWRLSDYDQFLLFSYQNHRVYRRSRKMVLEAEKAFFVLLDEQKLTCKWLTRRLSGIKDLAAVIRDYLGLCHFRCFEEHRYKNPTRLNGF